MSHRTLVTAPWISVVVLAAACTSSYPTARIERAAVTRDVLGAEAAVYFTLRVARPDTIVELAIAEASSTSMQSFQAHRGTDGRSAAPMAHVRSVPTGPSGTVRFVPGGYTGMIFGLHRALGRGDSVKLTVTLASGRLASTWAPVLGFDELEDVLDPGAAAAAPTAAPTAQEGERLYRANGCVSCHGPEGHGDGPVGRALVPPPRDFRVAAAFKGGTEAERIARTLAVGVPGGGSMPVFAHLTNHERRALALYVVSLRTSLPERSNTP